MLRATTRAGVHLPTVLAIGVVSFAAVTVIHEAGGHGLACLLVDGEALAVSSTELRCDGPDDGARLAVTAAGSMANILVGLAAMAAAIVLGPARGVWSYVLWLFGATNLFHAGKYLLIGPFTGFGDWSSVARNLQPQLVWAVGITVLGYGVNVVGSRLARRSEWQPLAGVEVEERETRMRLLTRLPLAAALVVSLAAGLLSPLQPRYALVRIASWAWVVAGLVSRWASC